jgi:hypothetical protein
VFEITRWLNAAMAQPIASRRAAVYRHRARELAETAAREWHEDRRRHLLDQAATFQRAAEQMDPQPPAEPQIFSK